MTHVRRTALLGMFLLLAPAISACSSHTDEEGPNADEYFYSCEDAPMGVTTFATDEAYRVFIDKIAATGLVTDETQAAHLTAPAADSTLSVATPPLFSLTAGMASRSVPAPKQAPLCPTRRSTWARV